MPFGYEIYIPKSPAPCSFRIYMVVGSISKTIGSVACYLLHLQERDSLCNEIFLSKYLEACSFRIYMVIVVYLNNPRSDCLSFMYLQEGDVLRRRPSEM